jgi:hypothetical protein
MASSSCIRRVSLSPFVPELAGLLYLEIQRRLTRKVATSFVSCSRVDFTVSS